MPWTEEGKEEQTRAGVYGRPLVSQITVLRVKSNALRVKSNVLRVKSLDFTRKTLDFTRKTLGFTRKTVIYDTNGLP